MNILEYFLIASSLTLTACSWVGVECQPPAMIAGELALIQTRDDERQWWQFDDIDSDSLSLGSDDVEHQYDQEGLQVGVMSERLHHHSFQSGANIELAVGSGWTIMPTSTSLYGDGSDSSEHVAGIDNQ